MRANKFKILFFTFLIVVARTHASAITLQGLIGDYNTQEPLPYATVYVTGPDDWFGKATTWGFPWNDFNFSIDVPKEGNYIVTAAKSGYEFYSIPTPITTFGENIVVLYIDQNTNTGIITGTVKDNSGKLLSGVKIVTSPSTYTVYTDTTGSFEMLGIPTYTPDFWPITYTLTASKSGYNSYTTEEFWVVGTVTKNITLSPVSVTYKINAPPNNEILYEGSFDFNITPAPEKVKWEIIEEDPADKELGTFIDEVKGEFKADKDLGVKGKVQAVNPDTGKPYATTDPIRIVYNLEGRIRYVGRDEVSEEDVPEGTVLGLDDGDKTIPAQYSADGFSFSNIFTAKPTIHAYSKKVIPYRIVVGDSPLSEHNFEISPEIDKKDDGNYIYYDPVQKKFKYDWILGEDGIDYNTKNRAAFNILKFGIMGYEYASPKGLIQDLNIVWYDEYSPPTSYYQNNQIHLQGSSATDRDEWDESVILHEFGHFVDDKLIRIQQRGDTFEEGFASFYRGLVSEENQANLGTLIVKKGLLDWAQLNLPNRYLFYIETDKDGYLSMVALILPSMVAL